MALGSSLLAGLVPTKVFPHMCTQRVFSPKIKVGEDMLMRGRITPPYPTQHTHPPSVICQVFLLLLG